MDIHNNVVCFFLLTLLCYYKPCLSASSSSSSSSSSSLSTVNLFQAWSEQHEKSYSSEQERLYRLRVFKDNLDFVTKHNMGNSSYTLSMNAFADLTHHEFKTTRLGFSNSQPKLRSNSKFLEVKDVPTSVDWRTKGAVTNVKDQGSCGACWSFSATGAMEGINKIVTGSLVSLSEQELIDCDTKYNTGCNGGLMDPAYKFVINNHGIDTENDYPYQGKSSTCNKAKLSKHVVTIDSYTDVPESNEKQLLQAVVKQPVSVGICGSERTFQLYSKGIFTGPCSTSLDHAVLIVGYGSQNGADYWIVKNSWGEGWGINGYIHMQRNINDNSAGLCGINLLASYPTKSSPNPPPSPSPGPSKCSFFTSCEEGQTCCCTSKFFGYCFSWQCCGLGNAVCCDDRRHCCPQDYPICDTKTNKCLKSSSYRNNGTIEALEFGSSRGMSSHWGTIIEGLGIL